MGKSLKNKDKTKMTGRERSNANLKPCKKGETHNPNGRPKGSGLTDLLLKEIEKIHPTDKDKKTWKQLIVEATMRLAIKGNSTALKEVWERIDGKVMLPIETQGDLTFIISKDYKPDVVKEKRE